MAQINNDADGAAAVNAGLNRASAGGDLAAVLSLLKSGGDPRSDASLAFRMAVRHGHAAIASVLLDHGAHVNAQGDEALRTAITVNDAAMAQYLVRRGAKITRALKGMSPEVFDDADKKPLLEKIMLWGAAEQILERAEPGTEKGALEDVFRLIYGDYKFLTELKEARTGAQGYTGLTLAASAGLMPELIAFALPNPDDRLRAADFMARDGRGNSALDALAGQDASRGPLSSERGLTALFNAAFWRGCPGQAEELQAALDPALRARLDLRSFFTEKNLAALDALTGGGQRRPGARP